jgi:acyl-coenzyme A synthetase/AMP-(fatty) acid ligase
VTFLSILASNAIALPLSSGFPASELKYILENSEPSVLLSSEKFRSKVEEVTKAEPDMAANVRFLKKHIGGGSPDIKVSLEDGAAGHGGLMLYTSGTTSRPVCFHVPVLLVSCS